MVFPRHWLIGSLLKDCLDWVGTYALKLFNVYLPIIIFVVPFLSIKNIFRWLLVTVTIIMVTMHIV